jgi:hypothetical protein
VIRTSHSRASARSLVSKAVTWAVCISATMTALCCYPRIALPIACVLFMIAAFRLLMRLGTRSTAIVLLVGSAIAASVHIIQLQAASGVPASSHHAPNYHTLQNVEKTFNQAVQSDAARRAAHLSQ